MRKLTRILSVIVLLVVLYMGVQYFEGYKEKKAAEHLVALELDKTQEEKLPEGEPAAEKQDEPDEYFTVSEKELGVQFWYHPDRESMEAVKAVFSAYEENVYFDYRECDHSFHFVSEVNFRNIMESATFGKYNADCGPGEFCRAEDLETIKSAAISIIESFGPVKETVSLKSFFTEERKANIAYTTEPYYAFNNEMLAGEEINRDPVAELIKRGVQLEITNAEALQCLTSSDEISCVEDSIVFVHVVADVKCLQNDGEFSDLSWIPESGESDRVDFVVKYACHYTELGHEIWFDTLDVME